MRNDAEGLVGRWSMGAPSFLAQHRAATEWAMRQEIAAARSGGERVHDSLVLTAEQSVGHQQALQDLERVSGDELARLYFKECVK